MEWAYALTSGGKLEYFLRGVTENEAVIRAELEANSYAGPKPIQVVAFRLNTKMAREVSCDCSDSALRVNLLARLKSGSMEARTVRDIVPT